MQQVQCQSYNLNKRVIGNITRVPQKPKERLDYVLVADDDSIEDHEGYAAVVIESGDSAEQKNRFEGIPLAICQDKNYRLAENDIVSLEPNIKHISVLYEAQADHNCLFVTERCNSRCVMCPQKPKPDSEDYIEINNRIIDLINPAPEYLTITGGEPTLLGGDLIRLVEYCRKKLPETKLMILTNAQKLKDRSIVEELAKVSQGYLAFAVPIYADVAFEHDRIVGVKGAFANTISGCQNLALYGMSVEIRVVILSMNYMRLLKIADFIYRNLTFNFHVAFMGLELQDLARDNLEQVWVDPYDYKSQLLEACQFLFRRGMSVSIYNHQLCTIPKDLWPLCVKSISRWKNIYMPVCDNCKELESCGGFFASAAIRHSDHILAIS